MKNSATTTSTCVDPMAEYGYPILQPFNGNPPVLPQYWKCTAVLHPFSPIQSTSTPDDKDSPFFEICTATVYYAEGIGMNALLVGTSGKKWWYKITLNGTSVSTDGTNYKPLPNIGWSVPDTSWFGTQTPACAGTSNLNWMKAQQVNWWKIPVTISPDPTKPKAATWMWFDSQTNLPVRLMFGQGPTKPTEGDNNQLALFQMFSFTYFPSFEVLNTNPLGPTIDPIPITNFSFGNVMPPPNNHKKYSLFEWNTNFGMTVFMTPVNEAFNPLPTRVLYRWKDDYKLSTDRSQDTLMKYTYNPNNPFDEQVALLTGPAPDGVTPPANSGAGFIINSEDGNITNCAGFANFPFPQEPPNWVTLGDGVIQATVYDHPVLCPGNPITIVSVLFPPALPNYPDSTYLWTWYSPNGDGATSRPVTFMQSQSGVNVGTSLALADYFDYKDFQDPIPPCNFDVPPADFEVLAKPAPNTQQNPNPSYPWIDTGIPMNPTTVATIAYKSGSWTSNPNDNDGELFDAAGNPNYVANQAGYTLVGANEGALIGRVGDQTFLIGDWAQTPPGATGNLLLCINDDLDHKYGKGLGDNKGSVTVAISVANT